MLAPGTRLGPYEITAALSSGGMGHVFRAKDTRLEREVAIKTLREERAVEESALARFKNEARAASALNHPGIVHIYAIDEAVPLDAAGVPLGALPIRYIAMELVAGETLGQKIRGGAPPDVVLGWMLQVAEALARAHEAGIVHRDLKPENVMISQDGHARILDFGLAKLMEAPLMPAGGEAATAPVVTQEGMIVGTAPYMSPEQIRGEPTSPATDVFSMGCMLFEALQGTRPFDRATVLDTVHAILHDEPPRLERADRRIQKIVARCLAKDRRKRYPSGRELAHDLRETLKTLERDQILSTSRSFIRPSTRKIGATAGLAVAAFLAITLLTPRPVETPPAPAKPPAAVAATRTVAVLPFTSSAGTGDDYLGEGVAESLIYELSRTPLLRVIPRSSVVRLASERPTPQAAGQRLGATAVVVGEVGQQGGRVVVRAELVDVATGGLLWGRRYDRSQDELLTVHADIARELRAILAGPAAEPPAPAAAATDPEAFREYLKGRYYWNKRTKDGLKRAVTHFQQSIDRDPGFALAWVGLGDAYALLEQYAGVPSKDNCPKAKEAIGRAMQLDPALAQAHASRALQLGHCDWDWDASEAAFRKALQLDPNYATAHHWYALHLAYRRRFTQGLEEARKAQQLDPLSLIASNAVAVVQAYAGQWDEVIRQADVLLEMDPGFPIARLWKGRAYRAKGQQDAAIKELKQALDSAGGQYPEAMSDLAAAYALAGQRTEALRWAKRLEDDLKVNPAGAYNIATVHASLGDTEKAIFWLERAFESRSWFLVQIAVEPTFGPLKQDPRYQDMIKRVRLE